MKYFGITVPKNTNQMIGLAGLGLVIWATLGLQIFWPKWMIPVLGTAIGLVVVGDVKGFLLAGLALFATKWGMNQLPIFGGMAQDFVNNLAALIAPAMLVTAIRSIYQELKGR